MSRFIGVDLHKTAFTICFMEGEEKRFETYKIDEVERFREDLLPDDEVALETTTNTRHFCKSYQGPGPRDSRHQPVSVQGYQSFRQEDRCQRCRSDGVFPEQGDVARSENERRAIRGTGEPCQYPWQAGSAEDSVEEQDPQHSECSGHRNEERMYVEL